MGNLINQCLYLLACCCLLTVSPAVSTPVTALKITLHHALSSLLVRGTPTEAQVSANGGAGGMFTLSVAEQNSLQVHAVLAHIIYSNDSHLHNNCTTNTINVENIQLYCCPVLFLP